ncbi:hypothetical protein [Mycoplasma phocimorsus]|uniref:hypothetical protein n=1 Tax=Mycoplasma phocimorsus TaxID=3045839 RepID=UPI0024BFC95A|nr:hypothetical protein [Mycoplasma phocimorsus]MDJ1646652.1 hypothetical protein [Mycoplasma phocimorsus]
MTCFRSKRLVTNADFVFLIWTKPKKIDLGIKYGYWKGVLVLGKRISGYRNVLTLIEKTKVRFTTFVNLKSPHEINSKIKTIYYKL